MRTRSVALVTRDPALYLDLAGFLRERRLPTMSLLPGDRIPSSVAVVLTSSAEAGSIEHPHVLSVSEDADRHALGAAIVHYLNGLDGVSEIVVGIDPGPRPGYAVIAGADSLGEGNLESPEAAGTFAGHLRRRFPGRTLRFRVGAGDPPARNRIVNALVEHHREVEIVDETRTTPRGQRRPRDAVAARSIARARGTPVRNRLTASFTPGEIANLQRLSRLGSGGRVTISRSSAHRVLQGELTLAEAVELATGGRTPSPVARPPSPPREPL